MDDNRSPPRNEKVDDVKLVELYATAGVYYAAVIIAVVFAQFSVLAFLRGKYSLFFLGSPEMFSIVVLMVLYFMILIVGWYFADRFLTFSELLDQIIIASQSNPTLKKLAEDEGQTHLGRRKTIVKYRRLVLGSYVVASAFALAAVLCLT